LKGDHLLWKKGDESKSVGEEGRHELTPRRAVKMTERENHHIRTFPKAKLLNYQKGAEESTKK